MEKCGGSRSLPLHHGDDARGQAKSFRAWQRKVLKILGVEGEGEDGRGEEKAKWVKVGVSVPDKQSEEKRFTPLMLFLLLLQLLAAFCCCCCYYCCCCYWCCCCCLF